MSGFIIAYVCLDATTLQPKAILEVWYRRFTRIVAIMWIAIWSYANTHGLRSRCRGTVAIRDAKNGTLSEHRDTSPSMPYLLFPSSRQSDGCGFLYDTVTDIDMPDRFSALMRPRLRTSGQYQVPERHGGCDSSTYDRGDLRSSVLRDRRCRSCSRYAAAYSRDCITLGCCMRTATPR